MTRYLFLLALLLSMALPSHAADKVYTPADVPNVHRQDARRYVSDPAGLMSVGARAQADARLKALADSTTVEMAVVVLPSIGDADIFDFAQELGTSWGIGKADKDNGLLLLFDMEGRQVRLHAGQGTEGIFTDVACSRIIDENILPHMREGNLDAAVLDATARVQKVMSDPDAAAELRSVQKNMLASPLDDTSPLVLLIFPAMAAVACYVLLFMQLSKLKGKDNFQKALLLHTEGSDTTELVLTVLSLGVGLPALLIRRSLKNRYRNSPRRCDLCGEQMQKLDEQADNAYLTPSQDLEEQLGSVDYDVWLCPRCGATEIFPFPDKNSPYTECPVCHTHAMRLIYDRVDVQPTATRKGYGTKVYECMNCKHRHTKRYEIAARPNAAPVLLGAMAAGAGRGRGGFGGGGGFSGGSFGGGSFGGGGSTGSW